MRLVGVRGARPSFAIQRNSRHRGTIQYLSRIRHVVVSKTTFDRMTTRYGLPYADDWQNVADQLKSLWAAAMGVTNFDHANVHDPDQTDMTEPFNVDPDPLHFQRHKDDLK